MERRLKLAKQLLNPADSVLIVTIDEKEVLRLGLLLEQTFPEARIQMVSSVIKAGGVSRAGAFGRSDEYIFFVKFGSSAPIALPLSEEWNPVRTKNKYSLRWKNLMRSGQGARREDSPNLFYPVFVTEVDGGGAFHSVGEPYYGDDVDDVDVPDGCWAVWPIRNNGEYGRWMTSPGLLSSLIADGYAKLGRWAQGDTTVYYLAEGERRKVQVGEFRVIGHGVDGSVVVDDKNYRPSFLPTTQWNIMSHDAGYGGARLISELLAGRKFPFPKSLYAVEDALRFFVTDKPDAVVLDFFAGSGTTAHAVMRLNRQDGGLRQAISVTNNEVSVDEHERLRRGGLRPGDPEWEALGICDYITKPRLAAAITGTTPEGKPVKGDYRFADEFPMADGFEENVEFFTLTYETPWRVARNRDFESIAALLWLRAGSRGRCIDTIPAKGWDVADTYGVIADLDQDQEFQAVVAGTETVKVAYIVTDDDRRFQIVAGGLPERVEPVRLYESYLNNFEINTGRE